MNFINPLELLDVVEADVSAIKTAKRRKLLEFELSDDGMIDAGNLKVSKSDFLRVTDELDNNDKAEFYSFIKNKLSLNAFLKNGDTTFFTHFRHESIYSDRGFIEFISPYFAEQYSNVLLETFVFNDTNLLRRIVANPLLVTSTDTEKAYKGLSDHLKKLEQELHSIRDEIDNEESYYKEGTVAELEPDLRGIVNVDLVNALPNYFQLRRNELSQKLRNISVAVFNSINDAEESLRIISFALKLESNNLTKQNLRKDYEQIKEIYESRKESEKYSLELAKYAAVLIQVVQLIKQIENNQIGSTSVIAKVNSLFFSHQLNQLPSVFDEIREQIALSIRGLSVAVWNEKNDLNTSLGLIQIAQEIKLNPETKREITKAQNELINLRDKQAEPILDVLRGINNAVRQVNMSYGQTVNTNKVSEVLNEVFNNNIIQSLSGMSLSTKEKIISELGPILSILPSYFVNRFVDKLSGMVGTHSNLSSRLQAMRKTTSTQPVSSSNTSSQSEGDNSWLWWVGGILFIIYSISQCN